jgi:hypothetical protein
MIVRTCKQGVQLEGCQKRPYDLNKCTDACLVSKEQKM